MVIAKSKSTWRAWTRVNYLNQVIWLHLKLKAHRAVRFLWIRLSKLRWNYLMTSVQSSLRTIRNNYQLTSSLRRDIHAISMRWIRMTTRICISKSKLSLQESTRARRDQLVYTSHYLKTMTWFLILDTQDTTLQPKHILYSQTWGNKWRNRLMETITCLYMWTIREQSQQ